MISRAPRDRFSSRIMNGSRPEILARIRESKHILSIDFTLVFPVIHHIYQGRHPAEFFFELLQP